MTVADRSEIRGGRDLRIVFNNSLVLFVRYAALLGLNGLLVLFLPRYLGDDGLGHLQSAMSFVSIFGIGITLGMAHFLIKEVARDHAQVNRYLGSAIGLRLLTSAAIFTAILITAHVAAVVTGERIASAPVIYVTAMWMIVGSFASLMRSIHHGMENMATPAMAETAGKLVQVGIGITVLVMGGGVLGYAIVMMVGNFVDLGVNAGYLRRHFPIRIGLHMPTVKTLVVGGAPFLLMGFVLSVYRHIDVVMLRYLTEEAVVGWYSLAIHLRGAVQFIPFVLMTALLPTLARLQKSDVQSLVSIARKGITAVMLVIVPIAIGLGLLSSEIITFLPYPDVFSNTIPLLALLSLSIPVTALLMVLGSVAMAVDRQRAWSIALLATVIFNIAANAAAIPYFQAMHGNGAIGAAASTLVSEVFMVGIGIWLVPRAIFDRATLTLFLKVALAASVMLAIGLILSGLGLHPVPAVTLGGVLYVGVVMVTKGVTVGELLAMYQAVMDTIKSRAVQGSRGGIS